MCLSPGLDCYKNEVKLSQDDCSVLPCKGIYADVVKYGVEDLLVDKHVLDQLVKYKEYKAGFNFDKGENKLRLKLCQAQVYLRLRLRLGGG